MSAEERTEPVANDRAARSKITFIFSQAFDPLLNSHPALTSIFSLVLALVLAFGWISAGSAQGEAAQIRLVRSMSSDETGQMYPAGLAFSPGANAFYVLEAQAQGKSLAAVTSVSKLDSLAGKVGSAQIAAQVQNPVNVAFDGKANRLLILQAASKSLLEVPEGVDGNLDPQKLSRTDVSRFGLQDPQGISVDPASGRLFILEAAGPQLVRIAPAAGRFDQGSISAVKLAAPGLGAVRGLAFDPSSGHLHVMAGKSLYEFTQAGQLVASRDLTEFALVDPQGMVIAPSGDLTDDPAEMSLYLADTGSPAGARQMLPAGASTELVQTTGQIVELTFTPPVAPTAINFTSTIVNTKDLSTISPPSPDPSGLTYVPAGNRLVMVDGEVEETVNGITHFQGANVWELNLDGSVIRTANVSKVAPTVVPMNNEPVGVTWNPANGHFFISSDGVKDVFDLNPGGDGLIGTSDDTWTKFDTLVHGNGDPEGIALDTTNNRLFVADGVNAEVYQYTLTGALISHFDVAAYGVQDPESVEFNPDSGTLFVMSSNLSSAVIVETNLNGGLIQTISISATNARQAAGLAYAPASNGSGAKRFYIVDRGIDNNSNPNIVDGKMFEMTTPTSGPPVNNPPIANDDSASTTQDIAVTINVAANDNDPDGNLDLASTNTACGTCDLPNNGNLANHGDGTFDYTPNPGFTGSDSFVYQICDTELLCDTASVSITVNPPLADLIFADGFESGSFSVWTSNTTDGGDLSVSAAAAMFGANGMQALIDDNIAIFVTDDTPNAEPRFRARFYFDPNSITMANGDNHFIFYGYSGASKLVLRIQFRRSSNVYQLRAALLNDGSTWTNSSWFTISDAAHVLEIDWRTATAVGANNGGLAFWIDEVQKVNLTSIDNDTRKIDRVRLGAVAGIDTGTRGTYFFDAFESRRQSYIGP